MKRYLHGWRFISPAVQVSLSTRLFLPFPPTDAWYDDTTIFESQILGLSSRPQDPTENPVPLPRVVLLHSCSEATDVTPPSLRFFCFTIMATRTKAAPLFPILAPILSGLVYRLPGESRRWTSLLTLSPSKDVPSRERRFVWDITLTLTLLLCNVCHRGNVMNPSPSICRTTTVPIILPGLFHTVDIGNIHSSYDIFD